MKCEKCGAVVVLKATSFNNNVHSRYWECPVCGWENVEETPSGFMDDEMVMLK